MSTLPGARRCRQSKLNNQCGSASRSPAANNDSLSACCTIRTLGPPPIQYQSQTSMIIFLLFNPVPLSIRGRMKIFLITLIKTLINHPCGLYVPTAPYPKINPMNSSAREHYLLRYLSYKSYCLRFH